MVVVDALSWGEADDGLIERWDTLPEWPQMLLRAMMFRLAVHACTALDGRGVPRPVAHHRAGADDGLAELVADGPLA